MNFGTRATGGNESITVNPPLTRLLGGKLPIKVRGRPWGVGHVPDNIVAGCVNLR